MYAIECPEKKWNAKPPATIDQFTYTTACRQQFSLSSEPQLKGPLPIARKCPYLNGLCS